MNPLDIYIVILVAILMLFLVWVVYTTRDKGPKTHDSLVDHDPSGSESAPGVSKDAPKHSFKVPTHDENGCRIVEGTYVPATHINRHTRRYLAKMQRSGKISSTI